MAPASKQGVAYGSHPFLVNYVPIQDELRTIRVFAQHEILDHLRLISLAGEVQIVAVYRRRIGPSYGVQVPVFPHFRLSVIPAIDYFQCRALSAKHFPYVGYGVFTPSVIRFSSSQLCYSFVEFVVPVVFSQGAKDSVAEAVVASEPGRLVAAYSVRLATFQLVNVTVAFAVGDWRVDFLALLVGRYNLKLNCVGQSFVYPIGGVVAMKPCVRYFVRDCGESLMAILVNPDFNNGIIHDIRVLSVAGGVTRLVLPAEPAGQLAHLSHRHGWRWVRHTEKAFSFVDGQY